MSTYFRDGERYESTFPTIRGRTGLLEPTQRTTITTLDDDFVDGRGSHATYTTTVHRSREEGRNSPVFYPRPPSPGRKLVAELQDQVHLFREELAKKDKLIAELTSLDVPRLSRVDTTVIDETFSQERINALATARSEIASLQVRIEALTSQLREAQVEIDRREGKIRELKIELETTRENEAKQGALVSTFRQRMGEYEATAGTLEGAASRSELAVQALTKQNAELQDRIVDLESRIRRHLEDREQIETRTSSWERKYSEIVSHFTNILHMEDAASLSSDILSAKLTEIVQENAALKGKLLTMKEYVNNAEVETKASRETIMRLVSEAEKEQRNNSRYSVEMDGLRVERDSAVAKESELRRELELLKERLESSQRAWQSTRRELEERESRFLSIESKAKETELFVRNSELQLRSFKEQLAGLLSDQTYVVEPYEDQIRERVRTLMTDYRDRLAHVELLENKVADLTEQLDRNFEISKSADRRAKRMEGDYLALEGRLRRVEDEAQTGEVVRDQLRVDKERFIERMCHVLSIDAITADVGLDMSFDTLLGRAEQLVKMEAEAIQDRKTHIHNLQRKLRSMKEQLESKDLHLDLMRKKVTGLEEQLVGRSELEHEKDSEAMKSRKLVKLAEKYKRELEEANMEIRDLKAKLLEGSEFKNRTLEAESAIDQLETKVGQLERVRVKQAKKIAHLKDDFNAKEGEISMKKQSINNTIQALSSELKTTKAALDEITKRERQLLDLRQVIARMLGLDITNLAVPDYEIIARLEKLILAHQSGVVTDAAIGTLVDDMEEGFRAGYKNAARVYSSTHHRTRSPTRKTTTLRTRARSLSPSRRKDTRVY